VKIPAGGQSRFPFLACLARACGPCPVRVAASATCRLPHRGGGLLCRGAAVICGTTHKTILHVIVAHEADGRVSERRDHGHNYYDVSVLVNEQVRASAGRISAKRLLPTARAAGVWRVGADLPATGR
jgi:hypothetical protein